MTGFVRPLIDKLRTITELQHVQVWNNQFDYVDDGEGYSFPFPCAFVETVPVEEIGGLGSGYQGGDLIVKVHLGTDFYNGEIGDAIDDNFNAFELRDTVVKAIHGFKSETSGNMFKINEEQDFNHSNVYHYILTYKVHYIDTTAKQDETYTAPPTNLTISHG